MLESVRSAEDFCRLGEFYGWIKPRVFGLGEQVGPSPADDTPTAPEGSRRTYPFCE